MTLELCLCLLESAFLGLHCVPTFELFNAGVVSESGVMSVLAGECLNNRSFLWEATSRGMNTLSQRPGVLMIDLLPVHHYSNHYIHSGSAGGTRWRATPRR